MSDAITAVLDAVTETAPEIRAGLTGRREYEADENPSGEQMLAADVHADQLLEDRLLAIDAVASYASEERDGIIESDDGGPASAASGASSDHQSDGGHIHVACDPLDGSSNL